MNATTQTAPRFNPAPTDDNDDIAVAAARFCFRWIPGESDAPADYDDEGEWVQIAEEVEINLSTFDDGCNELGLPPKLSTKLVGIWRNGQESEIEIDLRQTGFRRDGDLPIATYWARLIR